MAQLKLRMFGTPTILVDDREVSVDERKALALLGYLAVRGGRASRETLATLFWPELEPQSAFANLRHTLWRLRRDGLADLIEASRDAVALAPGYWLDTAAFQRALREDRPEEAVELYRDDFLAGFSLRDAPAFDEWQFFEAEHLRQGLIGALRKLVERPAPPDDLERAIEYARRLVAFEPLDEAAQRALMQLYAQSGQYAAALRQYQECARRLADELDAEPEAATTALAERIRRRELERGVPAAHVAPADDPAPAAGVGDPEGVVAAAEPADRRHIPEPAGPLIGREHELHALGHLLDSPIRLITLLGPGGIGKTRLAVAAAQQVSPERFPDGAWFVDLAPLTGSDQLVPAIADALELRLDSRTVAGRTPRQQLLDHLRRKQLLLVLDNLEQLLDDIGLVGELLQSAPRITILATSRARLQLRQEHVFAIQGLAVPEAADAPDVLESPAVVLFTQAARRARHDFASDDGLAHIAAICRLVEGMPLAIELAAGWVDLLPLADIAAELRRGIDLLATELRDVPARQRSIRAVFDASWGRLDGAAQATFARLSVFRGGFTRAAAESVAGCSVARLAQLVHSALLAYDPARDRYTLHELLRQYGVERLAAQPQVEAEVRAAHAVYFCGLLGRLGPELQGAGQQAALRTIEQERDNVRLAWQHAAEHGMSDQVARAADTLGLFFEWRGALRDGERAFAQALACDDCATLSAHLLAWRSAFCRLLGAYGDAQRLLQECFTLLDQAAQGGADVRRERAFALLQRATLEHVLGGADARACYEQSLAEHRALGQTWEAALVLAGLGSLEHDGGRFGPARRAFEESLALLEELGDPRGMALLPALLSQTAAEAGRLADAERWVRLSTERYQALGDQTSGATGQGRLGVILMWLGRYREARPVLEASLAVYRHVGNPGSVGRAHARLALALASLGEYGAAQAHIRVALEQLQPVGSPIGIAWALWIQGVVACGREQWAEAETALRASLARYRESGHVGQLGWSLALLSFVLLRRGEVGAAREHLLEVLRMTNERHDFLPLLEALPGVALLLAADGQHTRAVELAGLVWRQPMIANSHAWRVMCRDPLELIAAALSPEAAAAAWSRGQALDLWQTAAQLVDEIAAPLMAQPAEA